MHPDWARALRDQCAEAGVAFFMKQMTQKRPIRADLAVRQYPLPSAETAVRCRGC
jgi:protein gp37